MRPLAYQVIWQGIDPAPHSCRSPLNDCGHCDWLDQISRPVKVLASDGVMQRLDVEIVPGVPIAGAPVQGE